MTSHLIVTSNLLFLSEDCPLSIHLIMYELNFKTLNHYSYTHQMANSMLLLLPEDRPLRICLIVHDKKLRLHF